MCGRFTYLYKWRDIHRLLSIHDALYRTELPPRYNVAPAQEAPVALQAADGARQMRMFRWGLVPRWSKDVSGGATMINARAETVATRPAFRNAFMQRRCLIPVSGFYEWQKRDDETRKQPWYIRMRGGEPFCFAGLWERWQLPGSDALHTFTVITTTPNDLMRRLHDRMPVIVPATEYETWLAPGASVATLHSLLTPFAPEEMEAYRVSTLVNSPRLDTPACIEPAEPELPAEPTLFGK